MENLLWTVLTVAEILCPERKELISKISLSRVTVPRRLDDMAENMEAVLMKFQRISVFFTFVSMNLLMRVILHSLQYLSEV